MLGTKKEVYLTTTDEVDALIRQQYNRPNWSSYNSEHEEARDSEGYEIKGQGWNEDDLVLLDVTGLESEVDDHLLKNFLAGRWWEGTTVTLLNDLCRQNIIPAGSYLIRVIEPEKKSTRRAEWRF